MKVIKHRVKHLLQCESCGRKKLGCWVGVCQQCGGWMRYAEAEPPELEQQRNGATQQDAPQEMTK